MKITRKTVQLLLYVVVIFMMLNLPINHQIQEYSKNSEVYVNESSPNELPKAVITVNKREAKVGEPINFSAEKSEDPDGEIIKYTWDFGDNSEEVHNKVEEHIYAKSGNYTVILEVVDSNQSVDRDSVTISIVSSERPVFFSISDFILVILFIGFVIFGFLMFIAIIFEKFGKKFPILHRYIPKEYRKGKNN